MSSPRQGDGMRLDGDAVVVVNSQIRQGLLADVGEEALLQRVGSGARGSRHAGQLPGDAEGGV